MVGVLTGVSIGLLVWIEIHSRRNTAAAEDNSRPTIPADAEPSPKKKLAGGR
jgi:hypothetical protein